MILSSPESHEVDVLLWRLRSVQADERKPHPCASKKTYQLKERHAGVLAGISWVCAARMEEHIMRMFNVEEAREKKND